MNNWKDRLAMTTAQPTKEEQIDIREKEYAKKAMIIGDMFYKMECLKQEMSILNQEIIAIKGEKTDGQSETK
jgi:hypothetical protein